jgi:hypothetical protein
MDQYVRVAVMAGVVVLGACGRKPPRAEPLPPPTPARTVAPSAGYYDREGNLRSSGMRFEWLELPASFKRSDVRSVGGHEVYESDAVPFDKVCEFLGRRMFTGSVARESYRAHYPGVMPLDMNEAAPRLDVLVTQVTGLITIDVERRVRPDEVKPLSEEEARQLLSKELERVH